jgi:hypothetical protein
MGKRKLLDTLSNISNGRLVSASFAFRWQGNTIIAVEKIKQRLRDAGVMDKRISEIVNKASKKAVTTFRPFLDWLDVLATEEIERSCKASNSK